MRIQSTSNSRGSQRGLGILELIMTIGLFSGLLALFSLSLEDAGEDQATAMAEEVSQENALKGMQKIRAALTQTQIGGGFPVVSTANDLATNHPALAQPIPIAYPGHPGNKNLVFRTPLDSNNDGWPDVDAAGSIQWSPNLSALVLSAGADGNNRLCLVDSSGRRQILATHVASLEIDDSASSGSAIALNRLRIRLTMAPRDGAHASANPRVYESSIRLALIGEDLW